MTTKKYTKVALAAIVAGSLITGFTLIDNKARYTPRKGEAAENEKEEAEGSARYFFNMRKNAQTGQLDLDAMMTAQAEAQQQAAANKVNAGIPLTWQELGPDNVGGRTRAILIDLVNDPTGKTIFAGGVGGGLWKSTTSGGSWTKINDQQENLCVASITEAPDGTIYYGTGEGHYGFYGTGTGSMVGGGIFKSTDKGQTFILLPTTKPAIANDGGQAWAQVNAMATDPVNSSRIYACVGDGLRVSNDAGVTWIKAPGVALQGQDVEVGSDGSVTVASGGKCFTSPNGDPTVGSFTGRSGAGNSKLPSSGVRLELATAPSDPNYIYGWLADNGGEMIGSYLSTDKGVTWTKNAQGGGAFTPFGTTQTQGKYDNTIGIHPTNKAKAIAGGTDLYLYTIGGQQWTQISSYFGGNGFNLYVHPDKHAVKWSTKDTNIVYFGCDGGIYKTINANAATINFHSLNRNYNVTQFYSVGFGKTGDVIGGAQDNGSQYIDYKGNTPMTAKDVGGGDGGYTEISAINPSALFMEAQNASLARSSNGGQSSSDCYTTRIAGAVKAGAPFITPFQLWESLNDPTTQDFIPYVTPVIVPDGTVINATSRTNNYPLTYTTHTAQGFYNAYDTIWIPDVVQSKFALAINNSVWMAKNMLDFSSDPAWMKIASSASLPDAFAGGSQSIEFSKDGNHLYVGTDAGVLYRISNLSSTRLNKASDTLTGEAGNYQCQITCTKIATFGRPICGIGVDATNSGKVIVCLGSYDGAGTSHIYYTTTANTDVSNANSFVAKGGSGATKLPSLIVYDGIIDYTNGKSAIIGTDNGVYTTADITVSSPQWSHDVGFPNVPTLMIRQQQKAWNWPGLNNSGAVYVATHGRGIWTTSSLLGVKENANKNLFNAGISVYPNPARDIAHVNFNIEESSAVSLNVYDLQGKQVKNFDLGKLNAGKSSYTFDSSNMEQGTYIITMTAGGQKATAKFIVMK